MLRQLILAREVVHVIDHDRAVIVAGWGGEEEEEEAKQERWVSGARACEDKQRANSRVGTRFREQEPNGVRGVEDVAREDLARDVRPPLACGGSNAAVVVFRSPRVVGASVAVRAGPTRVQRVVEVAGVHVLRKEMCKIE